MRYWLRLFGQLALPVILLPLVTLAPPFRCAYVFLLMAMFWAFELLPLPVTSLLPVVFFPLLGIASTNDTSVLYMKGTNMMYLGSLMMAMAVESSGLHIRIALKALLMSGSGICKIMLGFMLPTAFLSMWISNAAATAMMLPIVEAVLTEVRFSATERSMLLLSVAYASNVGGAGTIIGTPPNLILMEFLGRYQDHPLNFGSWMVYSVPLVCLNLGMVYLILLMFAHRSNIRAIFRKERSKEQESGVNRVLRERYESLGGMTFHEKGVFGLFSVLVIFWFFRNPGFMPGWATYLEWMDSEDGTVRISSATPTILVFLILFIIPRDPEKDRDGKTLLDWNEVQKKFPWGIILLMGGGFTLAEGARLSCLSSEIGSGLSHMSSLPTPLILIIFCTVTGVISQIASNSATASMLIPIVLETSQRLKLNPLYLSLGVTMTASNAFMLPVSTPSNAIVYTAGGIRTRDMVMVGAILNILCMLGTILSLHTYGSALFDLTEMPQWVNSTVTGSNDVVCMPA